MLDRRKFLKTAAELSATLALLPSLTSGKSIAETAINF